MGEVRNGCDIWVGNLNKWDDIIKTNLKLIYRDCVYCIHLGQVDLNAVTNLLNS
jgi:hypothetical protein